MKLNATIRSSFKKDFVYGKVGQEVKIVGDYGNVVIVEAENGERFPVLKTNISDSIDNIMMDVELNTKPIPVIKRRTKNMEVPSLF